jgi:hypothetical protein
VSGILDLVARTGNTAQILDVKTSDASGAELAERYVVQAAVYSDAVRAITGASAVTFSLLPLPSGVAVEVTPAPSVDGIVAKLRASQSESP